MQLLDHVAEGGHDRAARCEPPVAGVGAVALVVATVEPDHRRELFIARARERRCGVAHPSRLASGPVRVLRGSELRDHELGVGMVGPECTERTEGVGQRAPRVVEAGPATAPVVGRRSEAVDPRVARIPARRGAAIGPVDPERVRRHRPDPTLGLHPGVVEDAHECAPGGDEVTGTATIEVDARLGLVLERDVHTIAPRTQRLGPAAHLRVELAAWSGIGQCSPADTTACGGAVDRHDEVVAGGEQPLLLPVGEVVGQLLEHADDIDSLTGRVLDVGRPLEAVGTRGDAHVDAPSVLGRGDGRDQRGHHARDSDDRCPPDRDTHRQTPSLAVGDTTLRGHRSARLAP